MNQQAKDLFDAAESSYQQAKKFLEETKYAESVDKFHDLVENALKSLLTLYGIGYTRTHDVSNLLPQIITRIPRHDPNFLLYSEIILPPFIVIHKILVSIRNLARYGFSGISQSKIFNEHIALSISISIEANYPLLQGWITILLYPP